MLYVLQFLQTEMKAISIYTYIWTNYWQIRNDNVHDHTVVVCHPSIHFVRGSSLFVGRVFSKWSQLKIGPVNQVENEVTTREKEAAHFIDDTGFILD